MKKLIAILLVVSTVFALFACGDTANDVSKEASKEVSVDGTSQEAQVSQTESKEESVEVSQEASKEEISEQVSEEASEEASDQTSEEASQETSEESEEPKVIPNYISNFVTWDKLGVNIRATDAKSIRLTAVNKDADYGDVAIYTYEYGKTNVDLVDGNYGDYAYMIATYDDSVFGCSKSAYYAVGALNDNSKLVVPQDGFIIAAHKERSDMVSKLGECAEGVALFAAGIPVCNVGYSIKKASAPLNIDGKIETAWNTYLVDTIDETNNKWAYWAFAEGDYYTTAKYFVTYDDEYLYLAVEVSSPYHYCPITKEAPNSMYKYECIQVKVSIEAPSSDYIREHYDHVIDKTADNEGIVRAYGFAVNDNGETCYYENSPKNKVFLGKAACTRDDVNQKTVYEVAIPWSEYGKDVKDLDTIGLTFSINSTNEEDNAKGTWKNLVLRDGGGVINRNDWAKIPEVTLD